MRIKGKLLHIFSNSLCKQKGGGGNKRRRKREQITKGERERDKRVECPHNKDLVSLATLVLHLVLHKCTSGYKGSDLKIISKDRSVANADGTDLQYAQKSYALEINNNLNYFCIVCSLLIIYYQEEVVEHGSQGKDQPLKRYLLI